MGKTVKTAVWNDWNIGMFSGLGAPAGGLGHCPIGDPKYFPLSLWR